MHFTQLRYQDPRTRTYPGSPSLARLPGGARNYHDSNRITFHRLVRFRELLPGPISPHL